MEFYIGFYEFLEEELLRIFEEIISIGKVLGDMNGTFIALIPKKNVPVIFEDFRLISLCNLIYKLVSMIIKNRMKRALSKCISDQQFSFIFNKKIYVDVGTT
jgi:hypothetical protein